MKRNRNHWLNGWALLVAGLMLIGCGGGGGSGKNNNGDQNGDEDTPSVELQWDEQSWDNGLWQ